MTATKNKTEAAAAWTPKQLARLDREIARLEARGGSPRLADLRLARQAAAGDRDPLVVAYGMGIDSTAVLVGFANRGIRPDLILFADTGGEKQETYDYLEVINAWLDSVGFPRVTVVSNTTGSFKNWPGYDTLETSCLSNGCLPSLATGGHTCSIRWKIDPQNAFVDQWSPALAAWSAGRVIVKVIGYEDGCRDRARAARSDSSSFAQSSRPNKERAWYPLIDWSWDRARCQVEILRAGLPMPVKSACFFCPASQPWEIAGLPADKLARIVRLEARARKGHGQDTVEGLWRSSTKTRPGSMTQYIRDNNLLPTDQIDAIEAGVLEGLVRYADQPGNVTGQTKTGGARQALLAADRGPEAWRHDPSAPDFLEPHKGSAGAKVAPAIRVYAADLRAARQAKAAAACGSWNN